jgi:nucleotide-binding universal stress UspA family protein
MEKDRRKFVIVTWDFTELSDHALQHAIKISKMVGTEIELLHILGKKEPPERETERSRELEQIAAGNEKKTGIPTTFTVRRGKIFSEIAEYASDQGASMVIMGTHGIRGSQKLFGSWALRVVVGSKVPFLVVQDPPGDLEKYENIVFPVDYHTENREKLKMAIFMGKYFDSKIHILKLEVKDKFLKKKLNTTMNFAIKYLIQNNISYEIHEIPPDAHLGKETLSFAAKINADLIIILITRKIGIVIGAFEQYLLANSSKIPVLCINPRSMFVRVGSFMYG